MSFTVVKAILYLKYLNTNIIMAKNDAQIFTSRGIAWLTSVIVSLSCISVGLALNILIHALLADLSAFALVSKYKKCEYANPCCTNPRSIEGTLATVYCCQSYCHYRSSLANNPPRSPSATVIIRDMVSCLALLVWQSECSVLNMKLNLPGIESYTTPSTKADSFVRLFIADIKCLSSCNSYGLSKKLVFVSVASAMTAINTDSLLLSYNAIARYTAFHWFSSTDQLKEWTDGQMQLVND